MRRVRWLIVLFVIVGVGWTLMTSWNTVPPGEVVVVRRLGRLLPEPWGPGAHLGWPWGLETRIRVRNDEVRLIEIGYSGPASPDVDSDAGEYLAGDRNIVQVKATIQYRVSDPVRDALLAERGTEILLRLAEGCLTRSLSSRSIDGVLRTERIELANEVESMLNQEARRIELGIEVLGVSLTDVRPPLEVAPDFHAAQSAESERDRRIREARSDAETRRITTESQAKGRVEEARAVASRTTQLAEAKAKRFIQLLQEAESDRPLTYRRLYVEMLGDVLPRLRRKFVLGPNEPVDLSVLTREPVETRAP